MEETLRDETLDDATVYIDMARPHVPFRYARNLPERPKTRIRARRLWERLLAGGICVLALYGGIRLAERLPAPPWLILAVLGGVAVGGVYAGWRSR